MGVTGLWIIAEPAARRVKVETLNHKRLAIDASIWIYQFLKAVRDKEGNALRNSHVVGFFRRICKLLYHGIKPVFVFDGGAPALKRRVISERKKRREGRRDDAVRTAGRILATRMQRRAEEEEKRAKEERESARPPVEEEPLPENLVYVDEIGMSAKERQQNRQFKKQDAYHLPNLDVDLQDLGAPNDPRIMSREELEEYARQFHTGEEVTHYDFDKIDFDSPFFQSLPEADRYNILNAARLRSRLRMGKTKEQLDVMFPNRREFSEFQIERVVRRNELTQRLMHVSGMGGEYENQGGRIAGEKGKEYVLVKNPGVEGGYSLGVVSNKMGQQDQPIDLDPDMPDIKTSESEGEDGFEDVPIEGLNRLPKKWARKVNTEDNTTDFDKAAQQIAEKRRAIYESRAKNAAAKASAGSGPPSKPVGEDDSFFVKEREALSPASEENELFEDVNLNQADSEDDELQRAIQMSLEKQEDGRSGAGGFIADAFNQKNAKSGREAAHQINARAANGPSNGVTQPFMLSDSEDEDAGMDLNAALAESRQSKYQPQGPVRSSRSQSPGVRSAESGPSSQPNAQFSGPLPFESLNLGQSLLGKKKSQRLEEDLSGGFDKADAAETTKAAKALPPWFNPADKQKDTHEEHLYTFDEEAEQPSLQQRFERHKIRRRETQEVIDVDAEDENIPDDIDVDREKEEPRSFVHGSQLDSEGSSPAVGPEAEGSAGTNVQMGDLADLIRAEPPTTDLAPTNSEARAQSEVPPGVVFDDEGSEPVEWSESEHEATDQPTVLDENGDEERQSGQKDVKELQSPSSEEQNVSAAGFHQTYVDLAEFNEPRSASASRKSSQQVEQPIDDDDIEFEDVDAPPPALLRNESSFNTEQQSVANQYLVPDEEEDVPVNGEVALDPHVPEGFVSEENFFSDEEDEELLADMAAEAEAHAEFASTFNHLPASENLAAYESELKRLRNQQKKDRRDADEVTSTMATEVQQLLSLFGLPYITAPMEAEAQCAELVRLGLVDGVVTDDSDIFLFGGTRVYKNMFNGKKFIECYLAEELEKEYNLTRRNLIACAQILGSDYCEGLPGLGPVSATDLLAEFGSLEDFAEWWNAAHLTDPKEIKSDPELSSMRKKFFRKHATKLFLPNNFPSLAVEDAYLHPEVDSDPTGFQWGIPDLDQLRGFLMSTIGWGPERMDEILVPVIKDMSKREREGTQSNLTRFFSGAVGAGVRGVRGEENGKETVGGVEVGAPRRVVRSGGINKALGRLKERSESGVERREEGRESQQQNEAGPEKDARKSKKRPNRGKKKALRTKRTHPEGHEAEADEATTTDEGHNDIDGRGDSEEEGNLITASHPISQSNRKRRKAN
ncbi:MAG: hypothetical protein Q9227_004884 [Pyrenula ochraceoflavens]